MICPIMSYKMIFRGYHEVPVGPEVPCFEEKCAWWNHGVGGCAILGIFANLTVFEKEGWSQRESERRK